MRVGRDFVSPRGNIARLVLQGAIGPFDRLFEASREEMSDRRDDSKLEAERIERAHAQRPIAGLRVLSRSRPSTPVSAKRYCHRHTVGRLAPTLCATRGAEWQSAEARTMRARSTCLRGRLRSAAISPGAIRHRAASGLPARPRRALGPRLAGLFRIGFQTGEEVSARLARISHTGCDFEAMAAPRTTERLR